MPSADFVRQDRHHEGAIRKALLGADMSVSGKGICTKPAITNLSGAHEQGHPRRRGLMPQSWPGR